MEVSSLKKNRPHLESVFGALSDEDNVSIRTLLAEVDDVLLEIAAYFGGDRAGWEGTGLELTWNASGQVSISSDVSTFESGDCIDFGIELQPSWCIGQRSSAMSWQIEMTVSADCQHSDDHGGMDVVHEVCRHVDSSPLEAANVMRSAAGDLKQLAQEFPLGHWLKLASDLEA